jgi:hypothetical protein
VKLANADYLSGMRFAKYLMQAAALLTFTGPLALSLAAGLVAMFAAFAGLDNLKIAAGAVCGASAFLWFALLVMGGELLGVLHAFPEQTNAPPPAPPDGKSSQTPNPEP